MKNLVSLAIVVLLTALWGAPALAWSDGPRGPVSLTTVDDTIWDSNYSGPYLFGVSFADDVAAGCRSLGGAMAMEMHFVGVPSAEIMAQILFFRANNLPVYATLGVRDRYCVLTAIRSCSNPGDCPQ